MSVAPASCPGLFSANMLSYRLIQESMKERAMMVQTYGTFYGTNIKKLLINSESFEARGGVIRVDGGG